MHYPVASAICRALVRPTLPKGTPAVTTKASLTGRTNLKGQTGLTGAQNYPYPLGPAVVTACRPQDRAQRRATRCSGVTTSICPSGRSRLARRGCSARSRMAGNQLGALGPGQQWPPPPIWHQTPWPGCRRRILRFFLRKIRCFQRLHNLPITVTASIG